VPSELIFDQGLGDLFIVRTAGHAVNELVLASLEYAVFALRVPLIMVLGHGSCGAVLSVIASTAEGRELPGHLPYLVSCIQPTLKDVDLSAGDVVERSIRANSRRTREYLAANSPLLAQAMRQQALEVVAAYYDLGSGRVELLDPA
jgi:carbonic anhydrase